MKNEAKTGLRGEQEGNEQMCIVMHFCCICVANLWCQKKVTFIFLHNGINKTSKFCFQKWIWIFFCGNLYSWNIIRILCRYCYKVLKNKKQCLIIMSQCNNKRFDTQLRHNKLSNVVKQHTFFEKSMTNPKCCEILRTFHWQFQLSISKKNYLICLIYQWYNALIICFIENSILFFTETK